MTKLDIIGFVKHLLRLCPLRATHVKLRVGILWISSESSLCSISECEAFPTTLHRTRVIAMLGVPKKSQIFLAWHW